MHTRRFLSADETSLLADLHEPSGEPLGCICLIHGYCDHRGRYQETAAALAQAGYRVLVPDLRGHGESGGQPAHIKRFGEYLEDIDATLLACAPGERPILMGQSMGGLVAFHYASLWPHRVAALAMLSPFLGLKLDIPAWKRLLGEVASPIFPTFGLPILLDPAQLSHDPEKAAAYAADPLIGRVATARWFTEILAAQNDALAAAPKFHLPVLLMHAGDDHITDVATSQTFFLRLGSTHKHLQIYEGLFHELLHACERVRVRRDMLKWLDRVRRAV